MVKFSDRTSTIFPLPSSPHWAPTITAVLPFFIPSPNRRNSSRQVAALLPGSHTPCPREFLDEKILGIDRRRRVQTILSCPRGRWQRGFRNAARNTLHH